MSNYLEISKTELFRLNRRKMKMRLPTPLLTQRGAMTWNVPSVPLCHELWLSFFSLRSASLQSQASWVIATTLCFLSAIYFRSLEEKLTQNKLILKEELKTLLHLCQSREDVELAKSVIYRWGVSWEPCQPSSLLTLPFPEHTVTSSMTYLTLMLAFNLGHWYLLEDQV